MREEHGFRHWRSDGVDYLQLQRPEKRNALNEDMIAGMIAHIDALSAQGCRCLVLSGAGECFCAGADLDALRPGQRGGGLAIDALLTSLARAPFVVIAAIQGAALGAGMELALFSDLRLAAPGATFAIPAARLGIVVGSHIVARLVSTCGLAAAQRLLLAAEVFHVDAACKHGLVHQVVPAAELAGAAAHLAGRVTALAPIALAGLKASLCAAAQPKLDAATAAELGSWVDKAWSSEDLVEAREAFLAHRPPRFRGS